MKKFTLMLILGLTLSVLMTVPTAQSAVTSKPEGTVEVDLSSTHVLDWVADYTGETSGFLAATVSVDFDHTKYSYVSITASDGTNPIVMTPTGGHTPGTGTIQLENQAIEKKVYDFHVIFSTPAVPSGPDDFDCTFTFGGDSFVFVTSTQTVNAVPTYAMHLDPVTSSESELTGTPIQHTITVYNDGNYVDDFTLSYSGDGTASYSTPNPVTIASGDNQPIVITMSGLNDGANTGTFSATSVGDTDEDADASLVSFVETTGVTLAETETISPVVGPLDQDIVHTITITNTGNIADTFDLAVDAGDTGVFGTNPVALDAGDSTTFTFTHEFIPDSIADYSKTATLRATSQTVGATTTTLAGVESQFKNYDAAVTPDGGNPTVVLLGNNIVLDYTIENTGGLTDTFTLSTTEGTLNPTSFTDLASGATDTFTLTISSPAHGNHNPTIEVTSAGASGVVETVTPSVDVVTVGVTLTPDSTTQTVRQGNDMTFTITVDNDGLDEDTYDLSVTPGAGDPTPVIQPLGGGAPITQITVAGEDSEQFEIYYSAATAEGDYTVDVTAESTLDPSVTPASDSTTLTSHFDTYGFTLTQTSADPMNIRFGQNAVHTFELTNDGSETDTFDITTTGGTLSTASLTLAPGATNTFTLTYTAPTAGLNQQDDVTVTSQGSQTYTPIETDTITVTTNVKTYEVQAKKQGTTKTLSEKVKVAGGNEVHTFTVTNNGNDEDTFDIVLTGDGTLSDATLTIALGDTDTFTVTHDTAAAGIDSSTVTVTSQGYAEATTTVYAKTFSCEASKHVQDNSANAAGTFTLDATPNVPFELDLTVTGAVIVDFYQLPASPRPSAHLSPDIELIYGTFTVDDKSRITTATATVHYTDEMVEEDDGDESKITVYYWNENIWTKATSIVRDKTNKLVTFTIDGTHWLERSWDYDFVLATYKRSVVLPPIIPVEPEVPAQDDFDDLSTDDQADLLETLSDDDAADLIEGSTTEQAAETIEKVSTTKAAKILSTTTTQKAAQILEKTTTSKAAAIIEQTVTQKAAEIIEQTQTEKAAEIVKTTTTQKATQILTTTTTTKAAQVMEKLENTKVSEIVEEAVTTAATDKVAKVLVETQKEKVADMLLSVKTESAAKVIKEMGNANLNSAAERVEEAVKKQINELDSETKKQYKDKIKATMENPELSVDDLVNLFVEIANLPNTPSTVAEIFEIIEVSKTVEVVDGMIAKDKLSEVGLVFSYLTPEKLIEIYTAMTSAAREAIYPYFDAETIGNLPEMTTFSVSADISDATVTSGTPVTVTADVENTGDEVGSIDIVLKVNGVVIETETVVLGAGESTPISWTVTKTTPGTYTIDVNGETATFTVEAAPEPAAFETSSLTVTLASVQAGEDVTVTVTVENTGEESGSYTVEVELDGTMIDSESVTLDGGASTTVTFTVSSETEGSHTVSVDDLSETFTVEAPPAGFPWTTAIIAIIVIAAVAGYLYMQQQKKEE